jgi:uncharacterized protein YdaU (DUF1376 family)
MAKGRLMAFRFFVDDWEGGTSYLSNEEAGAYIRLLIFQFRNDFIDPDMFLRICQNDEKIMAVLIKKFKQKKGRFYNERMIKVKDDACKYVEKQSVKGKKSAMLRMNRGSTTVEPLGSGSGSGIINNKKGVEFFEKCLNDEGWKESLMRATGIQTPGEWITKFNDHVTSTEESYPRLADYRRHCTHWVKLELEKQKNNNGKPKSIGAATAEQIAAWAAKPITKLDLGDFSGFRKPKDTGNGTTG